MSSAAPAGRTHPALVSLAAPGRALLTVAGDELRKDGGNEANRVPRADRTEQPQGWAPNLGIRCAVFFNSLFVQENDMLATRFASHSPALRSDTPLSDDQIRRVAPSIFADAPHESRSERYSYIPTATVLSELRKEGFQPFMVCQTRVRREDRRDFTKHMLRLGKQLQALEDGLLHYSPSVKAAAGAIVTIDRNGEVVIHRGLLREAEAKALRTLEKLQQGFSGGDAANDGEGEEGEAPKAAAISDRLAQRLSAHRTAALQIELARHPQVALAALVHGMVQTVLQGRYYGPSNGSMPLGVRLTVQDRLEGMAPDWPESPAAVALRELQEAWGGKLPEDSAELFAALLAMEQGELGLRRQQCASHHKLRMPSHCRSLPHQPGRL